MFIRRFELHLYKPLLHNGIKQVVVDDLTQQTILVAPNGFGKSSIMRELTPYPACRTDYERNGYKLIEFDHDQHHYLLKSDFSKSGSPHSFIQDEIELNQSGTTEVQDSLVQQYFNYDPVIDKLLSGEYLFCSMGSAARKELIYHTYPSSLTFVLDKYQDLKSKLRTTSSQLKLLNERKLDLTNRLLKQETLKYFEQYRKDLNQAIQAIDRELYLLDQIKRNVEQTYNQEYKSLTITLEAITEECYRLSRSMFELTIDHEVDPVLPEELNRLIGKLDAQLEHSHNQQSDLSDRGAKLRDEIEALRDTLNHDAAAAIKECKRLIAVQQALYDQNHYEDDTPILSEAETTKLETEFGRIKEDLQLLQSQLPIMSNQEYRELTAKQTLLQAQVQQLEPEVTRIRLVIQELTSKIEGLQSKHAYPLDCQRACKLRENLESVLLSYRQELASYQQSYDRDSKKLDTYKQRLTEVESTLQGSSAQRPILARLENLFTSKSWGFFACFGLRPLEAINQDITQIINRLQKIIQRSKAYGIAHEAKEKLQYLQVELLKLETADQPVKELITKTLMEKEVELNRIANDLAKLDKRASSTEHALILYKEHLDLHNRVSKLAVAYELWKHKFVCEAELKCVTNMTDYLITTKQQLNEKLRELDTIVKEQAGYLTRLKEEIEPSIKTKAEYAKRLTAVSEQLSPTSGIPYRYTVRYVNAILNLANQFIRRVWNYDLELSYFDEQQSSFDFTFPLLINHNSEVKDIKYGSKSQKSIINLAMRLAICIYRGYILQYPIKLDEIDDGCSPLHQDKLTAFLVELLGQQNCLQAFLANQSLAVNSSFSDAGMIVLASDEALPEHAVIKSQIN